MSAYHERWAEVRQLFEQTVDLEPAQRRAALARVQAGQDADSIGTQVQRLLDAADTETSVLDTSAVAVLEGELPTSTPSEAADPLLGTTVCGCVLLERLSSGGMGHVYLAERQAGSARHTVAVKILKRGLDTDTLLARFQREQETLAALRHEHIVGFLDAGSLPDGRPCLVMEHVDGRGLLQAAHALGLRARLELFLQICGAVQFAHQNLVLHRDLKPSNILVSAQGTPKLLDFGVATLLHPTHGGAQTDITQSPAPLTPRYASPEQLRQERGAVSTDVHALGLILFELLTERPARLGDTVSEVLAGVDDPLPSASAVAGGPESRAWARRLRGDLDAVIHKATQPEASRRYRSAESLAHDLRCWLGGEGVSAHRGTRWERARRFARNHRLAVGSAAGLIILLAAGLVGTWFGKQQAVQHASRGWGAHSEARLAAHFMEGLLIDNAAAGTFDALAALTNPALLTQIDEQLRDDPEAEAIVRMSLGRLALESGQAQLALPHLERAEELGALPIALGIRGHAQIQFLLGSARAALGDARAEEHLSEAVQLYEQLSRPQPLESQAARDALQELQDKR